MRALLIPAIALLFLCNQLITATPQLKNNPDDYLMPPPVPRPVNRYQNNRNIEPIPSFPYSMMQKLAGWFGYGDNKNKNTQKNPNLENEPQYPQNRLTTVTHPEKLLDSERLPKNNQLKTENRGYRKAVIPDNERLERNCNPCNKSPWVPMFQTPSDDYPIITEPESDIRQDEKLRSAEVEIFSVPAAKNFAFNKPQDSYMPQRQLPNNQHQRPYSNFKQPLVTTQDSYMPMPNRQISTIVGTGDYAMPPYRLPIQNDRFLAPIPIPNLSATPIPPLHDAVSFLNNPYKNQNGPQPEFAEPLQQTSNKIPRETIPNTVMMPPPISKIQEFPLYNRPVSQQHSRTPSNVNIPSININNSFNQNIRNQVPVYRKSPEENLHISNLGQLGMKSSDFEIVRSIAVAQFTQHLNYPTTIVDANLANFALKEATKSILDAVTERYKSKPITDDDSFSAASSHNVTVQKEKPKQSKFNFVTTRNPIDEESQTEDFSIETTTDYVVEFQQIDTRFQNRKEDRIKVESNEEYEYSKEKKRQPSKHYVTEKINLIEYATQTPYLQEYGTERYPPQDQTIKPTTIHQNYPEPSITTQKPRVQEFISEQHRVEEIREILENQQTTIQEFTSPRPRSHKYNVNNFMIPRINEQNYPEPTISTQKPRIQVPVPQTSKPTTKQEFTSPRPRSHEHNADNFMIPRLNEQNYPEPPQNPQTRKPTTIQEFTSPRPRSHEYNADNFKIPRLTGQNYAEPEITTQKSTIHEFISEQQRIEEIRDVPILKESRIQQYTPERHRVPLFNQQLSKIHGNYPQKSRLQEYSPQKMNSEIPQRRSKPIRQTQHLGQASLQPSAKKERDTPLNLLDTPIHYFQSTQNFDDSKTTQSTPVWNPSTQSPSSFTTSFYVKKLNSTPKPKQIQIIIPYTTKNKPMPFEKTVNFNKSDGWTSQSNSFEQPEPQESKVVTATQEPIRKTTAKYLTKILASSIRDLLKKEKQNQTTEMPKRESYLTTLQSAIDEWTEKQFSSPNKASTISLHFRPKQIPEEYLTTTLSYDETTISPTTYEPLYADQPVEEVNRNSVEYSNHRREKSSSTSDLWKKFGVSISPLTNERVIVVTPQPAWMEFRKINNFMSPRFVIRPTPGSLINSEKNPAVVYGESLAQSG